MYYLWLVEFPPLIFIRSTRPLSHSISDISKSQWVYHRIKSYSLPDSDRLHVDSLSLSFACASSSRSRSKSMISQHSEVEATCTYNRNFPTNMELFISFFSSTVLVIEFILSHLALNVRFFSLDIAFFCYFLFRYTFSVEWNKLNKEVCME